MEEQQTSTIEPGSVWRPTLRSEDSQPRPSWQAGPPQRYRTNRAERNEQMAKAIGWFSIGLGVAQLLAPRAMSRAIGMGERPGLMRALGMREIASGLGILGMRKQAPWLWTRVAGDAMDLAMLGLAASKSTASGSDRSRAGIASAAVAGIAVLDVLSSLQRTEQEGLALVPEKWIATGPVHVEKSIIVNRSPEECYRYWRDFSNFARFMTHLESVQVLDEKRSHWKAKGPAGSSMEWDSEITIDQPGQLLAWRSLEGAEVDNAGTVTFESAPGKRGTIVRVQLQYRPPGGKAGALLAKLFREEPSQQIDEDMRNFKRLIETGEIATTVGQPSGHRGPITRLLLRKGAPG